MESMAPVGAIKPATHLGAAVPSLGRPIGFDPHPSLPAYPAMMVAPLPTRRPLSVALTIAVALAVMPWPLAADTRSSDQLWLVSTRHLECIDAAAFSENDMDVSYWDAEACRWRAASFADLERGKKTTAWTAIYVHGNRIEPGEDTYHGRRWYASLRGADPEAPPVQMIIWSWPSSQVHGQIRDVRSKYWRAQVEVDYLGWYLRRQRSRPTWLVGFSYGALIVTGAVHTAAPNGASQSAVSLEPPPWSALLVAAAEPAEWIGPSGKYERFADSVRRAVVLVNGCDPALRRFQIVDRCTRPTALGYVGYPFSETSRALAERVSFPDVSSIAGRVHDEHPYRQSERVAEWIRETTQAAWKHP